MLTSLTKGGGGVSQLLTITDKGGGRVQTPLNMADIICEQSLIGHFILVIFDCFKSRLHVCY